MAQFRFAETAKVMPVIAPVAFTTSAIESAYVNLLHIGHWAEFHVAFGVMTSDTSDTVTLTVECSTAATSNATEVTLPFWYRLSAAVATDQMGAITSATTVGVAVTATDDAKMVIISVDPSIIPAHLATGQWLRLVATPTDAVASGVISAVFYGESRYPGDTTSGT